jgi:hypothetical protein
MVLAGIKVPDTVLVRDAIDPRWSPENRPYVVTSKPANGADPEQEYLYPANEYFCKSFFRE